MIADSNAPDTRADFHGHTGTLVAADHQEQVVDAYGLPHLLGRDHVTGDDVLVAVAETSGLPLHGHFFGPRWINRDLLDRPLFTNPVHQHCATLHGRKLVARHSVPGTV